MANARCSQTVAAETQALRDSNQKESQFRRKSQLPVACGFCCTHICRRNGTWPLAPATRCVPSFSREAASSMRGRRGEPSAGCARSLVCEMKCFAVMCRGSPNHDTDDSSSTLFAAASESARLQRAPVSECFLPETWPASLAGFLLAASHARRDRVRLVSWEPRRACKPRRKLRQIAASPFRVL